MPNGDFLHEQEESQRLYTQRESATDAATEMARVIQVHRLEASLSEATRRWIKQRQTLEAQRELELIEQKEQDRLRRAALAKLSVQEKKALGLS